MDTYDYNEDDLSTIARSCRHLSPKNMPGSNHSGDLSCCDCVHWNGSGCSRKHLESIASELYLD
jgi:hypothetical protein